MKKKTILIFVYLTIFAVAMGYLESSVVVYLRKIFYPDGFIFPLKTIDRQTAIVEIFREVATLIMLAGAGFLAGRTRTERFGFFLYCFGIWDIFYYVFLKLLIGWPESFLTWDILFLIPVTWVGPVIAPAINSLTMIILALFISRFTDINPLIKLKNTEWSVLIAGSLIILISYTFDYVNFLLSSFQLSEILNLSMQPEILDLASGYIPQTFPWWIYFTGEGILILCIILFYSRHQRTFSKSDERTRK
jgi:hypothetical protein